MNGHQRAQLANGQFPQKPVRHRFPHYKNYFSSAKDKKISLIWQIALLWAAGQPPADRTAIVPKRARHRGTAMEERVTLASHLDRSARQTPNGPAVGAVIAAIAAAAIDLSTLIADGPLVGITGQDGSVNTDGDRQKDIDLVADAMMRRALRKCPVAAILSEELAVPELLDPEAPLCVAIDPLDGSANLENNISVGTIFSIRPRGNDILSSFFEPGTAQCAAGFVVYGPQTLLILALDASVDIFIRDWRSYEFMLIKRGARIAPNTLEFAINASNRRHWHGPVRAYIDECLAGASGDRGVDFNMRWIGSLVAEALRILVRGGVFLYPADARPGYREGRLRLLYEAHPMALVMEWAGGAATTGRHRILELSAKSPHQRVPLIMGSVRGVQDVVAIHEGIEPMFDNSDAPLFARRGLFREGR
jgi:fructose-1,6-bisphosphatase I